MPTGTVTSLGVTLPVASMVMVAAIGAVVGRRRGGGAAVATAGGEREDHGASRSLCWRRVDPHQKNFLEMLNPRYQSSLDVPPRAS